jgi:hypothetical protein
MKASNPIADDLRLMMPRLLQWLSSGESWSLPELEKELGMNEQDVLNVVSLAITEGRVESYREGSRQLVRQAKGMAGRGGR